MHYRLCFRKKFIDIILNTFEYLLSPSYHILRKSVTEYMCLLKLLTIFIENKSYFVEAIDAHRMLLQNLVNFGLLS